jgi:glutamate-1-semialdehyde aminotransferase
VSGVPAVDRTHLGRLQAAERERFDASHRESLAHHRAAREHLVLGVPMPWMLAWDGACPLYVERGEGARLVDVDGNEYVDLCLGDTGAMTGHSPPPTVAAIGERAAIGMTFMLPTADVDHVSQELGRRFGLPRWQYTLSATDANRHALRYARVITGRPRILIFDRCYHGTVSECFATLRDGVVVPREGSVGAAVDPAQTTRVVPFNDLEALSAELAHGDVACVLTEPAMTNTGVVLPLPGFHQALRETTRRAGTLLIIDETHTLSAGPGGMTGRDGIEPDMLVVGKAVAGGVPAAGLGMTEEAARLVGEAIKPDRAGMAGVGGTLAANALSLAAMRATLEHVLTEAAFARTDALGARCEAGIGGVIADRSLPWHVVRIGGRVEYHFTERPLRDGAEGAAALDATLSSYLHLFALNRGVLVFPFHNRCLVSPVHTDADVDRHTEIFAAALEALFGPAEV